MRKIYLMSPREPSGATWLINCFIELGIKTYRDSPVGMWRRSGRSHALNDHEEILKKWLPSLWKQDYFAFRDDVEVQWSHEWPTHMHDRHRVVYFVRDPRDSLYSRYKRESPDQSFEEFIEFPDVNTLLNKIDNWRLYNLAWLTHPDQKVFRFEDYKQDAFKVLANILDFLGLEYSGLDIDRAIKASTYEMAAAAEARYRDEHPDDRELINRGGKIGEWKQGNISQAVVSRIEKECADVMHDFGYLSNENLLPTNYSRLISSLSSFQHRKLPLAALRDTTGRDAASAARAFARAVNIETLTRAKLRSYEISTLLDSCEELMQNLDGDAAPSYFDLRKSFRPAGEGLLGRIRQGIAGRFLVKVGLYSPLRRLYRAIRSWKLAQ